jgi:hypothetical protein
LANFPLIDAEEVKRQVKVALASPEFERVLNEIYELKGSDLEVRLPIEIYTVQKYNPAVFPCFEIVCGASHQNSRSEAKDLMHDIGVFVHERGDDEEEIDKRVIRYLTAIREYFTQFPYVNMIASTPVVIGDDNYAPFVPVNEFEGRPFIKSGLISIFVRTIG